MNKRLVVSALVTFPIMLLGNHYWVGRGWLSSFVGTIVFELMILPCNYHFLKWPSKKAIEQNGSDK